MKQLALLISAAAITAITAPAVAGEKFTVMTSWYAQAEHGGLYQAKAAGIYEKNGLDVTIKMGGPQVNSMQLLLAGEADVYSGFDFQTLNGVQQGLPLVTIAAQFQHDLQGIITHPDVNTLADLKTRTILIATPSRVTFWPWMKAKYGLSDEQTKPYTFNPQPFMADPNAAQQGYASSEPFTFKNQNIPYKFFLFADEGYPPYGSSLITRTDVLAGRRDTLRRFVRATMEGWKSYLNDPAPGNDLIRADNPKMSSEQIAFAVAVLKSEHAVESGDAKAGGLGTITEARFKATFDYMVSVGLLKPETDWRKAFTTSVVDGLGVAF